jgi:hypothetical protein
MHSISLSQVHESIEAIQPLVSDLEKNKNEIIRIKIIKIIILYFISKNHLIFL